MRLDLCVGNLHPHDSYGQLGNELVRYGAQYGVTFNPRTISTVLHDEQTPHVQALLQLEHAPSEGTVVFGYPSKWGEWFGDLTSPVVAVTMFESTTLPPGWVDVLNTCAAVIVPSRFCEDVFRANGVTAPLQVIPLGINEVHQYVERPAARTPYTFLTLGDRNRRKGWDIAVKAFHQAFKGAEDVRLIIKRRGNPRVRIQADGVEYLSRDMTRAELQALFADVDCYIDANHGEGFGLMGREAAASGLPVIATNWGGTADHIRQWAYPLNYRLVKAWPDALHGMDLGQWAEPDVEHLAQLMRYVKQGNPFSRYMGWQAARRVRRLYSWRRWAEGVLDAVNEAKTVTVTDLKAVNT